MILNKSFREITIYLKTYFKTYKKQTKKVCNKVCSRGEIITKYERK